MRITRLIPAAFAALAMTWSAGCSDSTHSHDHDATHRHTADEEGHDTHGSHPPHEHGHEEESSPADAHGDEITLSPESAARFGVRCERIEPGEFHGVIKVSGRIDPAPSDMAVITAPRAGTVRLGQSVAEGMRLGTGQAVATVSPAGVAGGDPQRSAIATRDAARREVERIRPLVADGIVSQRDYEAALRGLAEAEAAVGSLPAGPARAVAPRAGTLSSLAVRDGEYVETGQVIGVVSASGRLTLRADVPLRHRATLPSVVSANFRPDCSDRTLRLSDLNGRPVGMPGAAPSDGAYVPVVFSFDNDGSVIPGSFAEVSLLASPRHDVLTVPVEALVDIQGVRYVYTRVHDDAYMKHAVTTGDSDGLRVEILSGLTPGDMVVASGAGVVRMAETSNIAPPGHSHSH